MDLAQMIWILSHLFVKLRAISWPRSCRSGVPFPLCLCFSHHVMANTVHLYGDVEWNWVAATWKC